MFQLKEVEKIASKEKGVVIQTVKDILKELVEDNLVDSDKVGTSVYFWAFPGKGIYSQVATGKSFLGSILMFFQAYVTDGRGFPHSTPHRILLLVSRQRKSSRVELRGTLKKLHQVQAEIQRKVEEKQHATNEEGDITVCERTWSCLPKHLNPRRGSEMCRIEVSHAIVLGYAAVGEESRCS